MNDIYTTSIRFPLMKLQYFTILYITETLKAEFKVEKW